MPSIGLVIHEIWEMLRQQNVMAKFTKLINPIWNILEA